jgi:hypothetical protein
MYEHQDPEETAQSNKDKFKAADDDLKEAAGAKSEEFRQAAGQKADELREAAHGKAQELRGTAETAWSDASSQAKSW